MPNSLALSGQIPNDPEHNGLLDRWEPLLVAKGGDARLLCLVVLDVPKITTMTDDGTQRPIIRLRHIEPVSWLEDADPELVSLLTDLKTARSGGDALPGPVDDEPEVYATGPDDDPNRAVTLKRGGLRVANVDDVSRAK